MVFFDTIILGLYYILENTIHAYSDKKSLFRGGEHAVLISGLAHSLNIHLLSINITNSLNVERLSTNIVFVIFLSISALHYFFYISESRLERLIEEKNKAKSVTLSIIFSIVYVAVTCYMYVVY